MELDRLKKKNVMGAIAWLCFLLLCSCGPKPPISAPCVTQEDCSGLTPCVDGTCVPECSEEQSCPPSEEFCVFGGCTALPFDGPFFVRTGSDIYADEESLVILDGSDTIYVGEDALNGQWLQVSGPLVDIEATDTLVAQFEAPSVLENQELLIRLVVFDAQGTASGDRVVRVIDTINEAPIAKVELSPGEQVVEENIVTLDASSSLDPNPDDTISFTWSQTQGPSVEIADIGGLVPNQKVQFLAPKVTGNTDLVILLRVEDSRGGFDELEVKVRVRQLETVTCTSVLECLTDAPCTTVECVAGLCLDSVLSWCCSGGRDCDDDDPCTEDYCDLLTGCSHRPLAACCREDEACESPGGCWEGICAVDDGRCSIRWIDGCCTAASDCAPSSACVRTLCNEGQCVEVPESNCCLNDESCSDGDLCTSDYCDPLSRTCRFEPISGCCESDAECLTGNPCLQESCDLGSNQCSKKSSETSCCSENLDCDDSNPCTEDLCDLESGLCTLVAIEGCCSIHSDCQQVEPCTISSCVENACTTSDVPECCHEGDASFCDDGVPCTEDLCVAESSTCIHRTRPTCCTSNLDCDDGLACTNDQCDALTGVCLSVPSSDCCNQNTDCDDDNPCTSETCVEGLCVRDVVEECCSNNTMCDDGNSCTIDQCEPVDARCSHELIEGCCNVDDDCTELSEPCRPSYCFVPDHVCVTDPDPNCCAVDGNCAVAAPCVLRMCLEENCVSNDLPFCCLDETDCDDGNLCTQDSCDVLTGTCTHQSILNCCRRDADCVSNDECSVSKCDTASGTCTLFIDPSCCTTDADCDDGAPCTDDSCVDGVCQQDVNQNCCNGTANCTPSNACDAPICEAFSCSPQSQTDCCLVDADCAFTNPCSVGLCDVRSHQCFELVDPNCCVLDSDCDDQDPCTENLCSGGVCSSTELPGACCSDSNSCTNLGTCEVSLCSSESSTCVDSVIFGCCLEDGDCASSIGCGPHYCDGLNNYCLDAGALCCTSDQDCDTQTECAEDRCVQGRCESRNSCCITSSDCDDQNPCTSDVCTQEGLCSFSVSNLGLACDDKDSNTHADYCDARGVCLGFHVSQPPLSLTGTKFTGLASKQLNAIGMRTSEEGIDSIIALNALTSQPNQWVSVQDEELVSISEGYALSRSGAVWELMQQSTLNPVKNVALTTMLAGLGIGDWNTLSVRKDVQGIALEILAGGSSDILARCVRLDQFADWSCSGEDVGAFVGIDAIIKGWPGGPEHWIGSLGTDGSVFLLGYKNSWTNSSPEGCGLNGESCGLESLSALLSWPEVELSLALGSPGTVLRWDATLGWKDQGPPPGVVGPALNKLDFRGAVRDGDLLNTVAYEHQCALPETSQSCPLFVGRWWLWPALVNSESLVWLSPILLNESYCDVNLDSDCDNAQELGPKGFARDATNARMLTGGVVKDVSGQQVPVLLWRP